VVSRTYTLISAYSDQNQTLARLDTMLDLRWQVVDSNHCRHTPTDLALHPQSRITPLPAVHRCMNAMCTTEPGHYRCVMPLWRLRDYDDDDLDQAIQIWDQSRTPGSAEPVFTVAEVVAGARAGQPAVVAEVGDEVVGMAVARTDGERAWVLLIALASRWRHRGIGSALLADLERRLRSAGVRKICTILGTLPSTSG
jgi:GNAT superfamily N-acetyltransferase